VAAAQKEEILAEWSVERLVVVRWTTVSSVVSIRRC